MDTAPNKLFLLSNLENPYQVMKLYSIENSPKT